MRKPATENPEDALWRLLQSRIGPCLQLLDEWLGTGAREPHTRATTQLARIHAGTEFLPARRLRMFCRQWLELLLTLDRGESVAASLHGAVLQAGVRIEQRLAWGGNHYGEAVLDVDTLNRMRLARGLQEYGIEDEHVPGRSVVSPAYVIGLQAVLQRALRRSVPDDQAGCEEQLHALQIACFWDQSLALPRGGSEHDARTTSLALIECWVFGAAGCRGMRLDRDAPLPTRFRHLCRHRLLRVLLGRWQDVLARLSQQQEQDLDVVACVLAQARVCLRHFAGREASRAMDSLCELSERLVLHLQSGFAGGAGGERLLGVCLLTLEQCLLRDGADPVAVDTGAQTVRRLKRRIGRFLHARQRGLCESLQNPGWVPGTVSSQGFAEMQSLVSALQRLLLPLRGRTPVQMLPDALLFLCTRLAVCALCLGQVALYEIVDGMRTLFQLTVERRLSLSRAYLHSVHRVLASMMSFAEAQGGIRLSSSTVGVHQLARARLLAVRQPPGTLAGLVDLPAPESGMPSRAQALPIYLADHLHILLEAPEQLRQMAGEDFLNASRACLLELSLLAQGARSLAVLRVAELADMLAEVHRALQIGREPPSQATLALLCEAHQTLRACLNQAAARQSVADVRAPVARLYAWLEAVSPLVPDRQHGDAMALTRGLAAGMRALEDALTLLPANHRQGLPILRKLLMEQQNRCRQLEEELEDTARVSLGRWRSQLWRVAARSASAAGKTVRMQLENDALCVDRRLAEVLLPVLVQALEWLIVGDAATTPQQLPELSRGIRVQIRPRLIRETLVLALICDSEFASQPSCDALPADFGHSLEWLGGNVALRPGGAGRRVLVLTVPATGPRWDIAAKPL